MWNEFVTDKEDVSKKSIFVTVSTSWKKNKYRFLFRDHTKTDEIFFHNQSRNNDSSHQFVFALQL